MPIVSPDKVNIALPEESNDIIVYAKTQSYTLGSGAAGTETSFTLDTGLGNYGLPFGIYTFDGGVTYNDLGKLIPNSFGTLGTFGYGSYAPTVSVEARSFGDGTVVFNMRREFILASPVTVTVSFGLFMTSSFPLTLASSSNPTLPARVAYSSKGYYRKEDTTVNYIQAVAGTVSHTVGKVPMVEFWFRKLNSGNPYYGKVTPYNDALSSNVDTIKVDASNVIVGISLANGSMEPRVYKET